MYLNKKQVKAINTAIYIMSTELGNGSLGKDYEEVSEATNTLIEMVEKLTKKERRK